MPSFTFLSQFVTAFTLRTGKCLLLNQDNEKIWLPTIAAWEVEYKIKFWYELNIYKILGSLKVLCFSLALFLVQTFYFFRKYTFITPVLLYGSKCDFCNISSRFELITDMWLSKYSSYKKVNNRQLFSRRARGGFQQMSFNFNQVNVFINLLIFNLFLI